jgi:nucleoid DNA-binding protein
MTKADLVEQVTASIAKTAGPMISKKDCARVVDAARPGPVFKPSKELRALVADETGSEAEPAQGM